VSGWRTKLRRGTVGPVAALVMTAVFGASAIVVDAGMLQYQRRALQAAVDAAALSAARAPLQAATRATEALARIDPRAQAVTVMPGVYVDDPALAPLLRFVPGGTPNAVSVVARRQVTLGISQVLTGNREHQVTARAIAEHRPVASFTLGSGTAAFDQGVLNQVLGGLLGGSLNFTAGTYVGLWGSDLRALAFLDALDTQVGLYAGSYGQLMSAPIGVGQLLSVTLQLLAPGGTEANALQLLSQTANAGRVLTVGDLVGLRIHEARPVGDMTADPSYLDLNFNAFEILTGAATLGGRNSAIALPVGLNLPGLAQVGVRLMVVEPPQPLGSALALGPVGSRAATQQVRLLLNVQLLSAISGGVVNLPLLVEASPAQAELREVSCQGEPRTDTVARVRATTGLARVQIGQVTNAQFNAPATSFGTLSAAPILNLTIELLGQPIGVTVWARASASLSSATGDLTFTPADIEARTIRSVTSGGLAGSLVGSLGSSMVLTTTVDLGGVAPLLVGTVNALLGPVLTALLSSVATALTPALAALDPAVDQILAGLGLRLGFADVRLGGVRCGVASLVL